MRTNTFKLVTKILLVVCICLVISEVTFSNIPNLFYTLLTYLRYIFTARASHVK